MAFSVVRVSTGELDAELGEEGVEETGEGIKIDDVVPTNRLAIFFQSVGETT